jgi:hypothetical protein
MIADAYLFAVASRLSLVGIGRNRVALLISLLCLMLR